MNFSGAMPRGIRWNSIFPTQRVGAFNQYLHVLRGVREGVLETAKIVVHKMLRAVEGLLHLNLNW